MAMSRAKAGLIRGASLLAALATLCVLAPSAGAVLVRVGKHQVAGITLARGVRPASLPNSLGKSSSSSSSLATPADTGTVSYHGGPVLHSATPYLIFWDPNNELTPNDRALFERYFNDAAADSAKSSDVFGVDRQYTDSTGFAGNAQTWSSSNAISDSDPYPTSGQCTDNAGYPESACLLDSQLQTELTHVISAHGLPTGTSGNAPIYFIVTPPDVNSCIPQSGIGADECADNTFCAFHSHYTDGASNVLYADIPTVLAKNDPKQCQNDGNTQVQSPNNDPMVDVALKYMSHEDNETITDPLGTAWYDTGSGDEIADECNSTGAVNPGLQTNPNAFLPILGGSATTKNLFDQLINKDEYYTQSVWSNGNSACEMRPVSSSLSAAFNAPSVAPTGQQVSFDPSPSSSAHGFSSSTWDFGDGSSSFSLGAPQKITHAYTTPGTYTAKLTLVDQYGNLATVSHTLVTLTAAFTSTPANPQFGTAVSFNGSGSGEPGGSISSYSWNFGDGSPSGSGSNPTHTYTSPGIYTVLLTVTDSSGNTDTVSHLVTVHGLPSADFTVTTTKPAAGSPVSFDGSGSSEPDGSISSYSWNFGDPMSPALGSGPTPSHTYSQAGTYTITLTVTDAFGNTAKISQQVTVVSVPKAVIAISTANPAAGTPISLIASNSTDVGSTITTYSWNFGDNSGTDGNESTTHIYTTPGVYTLSLKITDATGNTNTVSQQVTVHGTPTASFRVTTANPAAGSPVAFDGTGSSEPFGSIASYSWNFGDGSPLGSGAKPTHTYTKAGTYTVTLTVTDQSSNSNSISHSVTVSSVLQAVIAANTAKPLAVSLSAAGSTDAGSTILSYSWSFGDGTSGTGASVSHTYASPGVYTVSLTVKDSDGSTSTVPRSVTVHGAPAAAFTAATANPTAGAPVSFNGSGSGEQDGSIASYSWNFGDGSAGSGPLVSHTYLKPGIYTATLTIRDGSGATSTATRSVNVGSPSITVVKVKKGGKIERLTLTITGPGTLKLGSKTYKIRSPGKSLLKVRLSPRQIARHRAHQRVTVRLRLRFLPTFGNASSRMVTIKLKG